VRENAELRKIIRSLDEDIGGLGEHSPARLATIRRGECENKSGSVETRIQIRHGVPRERDFLSHTGIVFSASFRAARIAESAADREHSVPATASKTRAGTAGNEAMSRVNP